MLKELFICIGIAILVYMYLRFKSRYIEYQDEDIEFTNENNEKEYYRTNVKEKQDDYKKSDETIEKVVRIQREAHIKQMNSDYDIICERLQENDSIILKQVSDIIAQTYKNFGIEVMISKADISVKYVIFRIVPHDGIKVKTVLSYKDDISLRLGVLIDMQILPKIGCVGIIIPIEYFKKMIIDDRAE